MCVCKDMYVHVDLLGFSIMQYHYHGCIVRGFSRKG